MEQKEPHSISLKVLRLSRPALAEQFPLPLPALEDPTPPATSPAPIKSIDPRASLSHPSNPDPAFILTPLLSLPTGFGTAFVGSTFSCTISANNELPPTSTATLRVSSVAITAEVSTPTQTLPLQLSPSDPPDSPPTGLEPGATLQRILNFDLREEGPHTLAVSVAYETTTLSPDGSGAITGRRTRTFRKLYQFSAVPCLSVRTKATDLLTPAQIEARDRDARLSLEKVGERFALEAQLENLTDGPITLEKVGFEAKAPFKGLSLNWDMEGSDGKESHLRAPTLGPRAVHQVCYMILEDERQVGEVKKEMTRDGRFVLGTLSIRWRGPMGEPGVLSTGWLTSKRR